MKETEELVSGVAVVVAAVIKELKDGLQLGKDAVALVDGLMSTENRAKLVDAVDGALKVKEEFKSATAEEWTSLGVMVALQTIALVKAAKA